MAVIVASAVGITIPASNALINNSYDNYISDNQLTARYGNTAVCGDHMCAPGEWDKLQESLTNAQLGYQVRNQTQPSTVPATPPATSSSNATTSTTPEMPTGVTPKLCASVKTILSGTGISNTVISEVMADLGCS